MRFWKKCLACATAVLLLATATRASESAGCDESLSEFARKHQDVLQLGVYVTAQQCLDNFDDRAGRREAVSVLRSFGVTNVYLESHRGGTTVPESLLVQARDCLRRAGFEVAGGIATTPGEGFGVRQEGQLGWLNFQNPKTQQDLERVVRLTARVFDRIIVDDFLCTADTSEESRRAKGSRSWSEYRRNLLVRVARERILKPARAENPRVTVIVKFPQWYDRFHLFGYDVPREAALFDGVWVGTETRGARTQRMGFVQPYEGFVNFRWISSVAGPKVGGAWFDHIDCDANDFYDQCVESVLAGARQIILFNYGNLMLGHPGHHLLRRRFMDLFALAGMVRTSRPLGVYGYKPPNTDAGGDLYIFDYLGMLGFPLLPTASYPADARVVFLPTQAAGDPQILQRLTETLRGGGTLVVTAGFLKKLRDEAGLLKWAGVEILPDHAGCLLASEVAAAGRTFALSTSLPLEAKLRAASARVLVAARTDSGTVPLLTESRPRPGGKLVVFNSHTFSESDFRAVHEVLLAPRPVALLDLPEPVLNVLRGVFSVPGELQLHGPGRVALHTFEGGNVVLCNFNDEPVDVELEAGTQLRAVFAGLEREGNRLEPTGKRLHLSLRPRTHVWVKITGMSE